MVERILTDGRELEIRYPAAIYLTVKSSEQGLDSSFTLEASFSQAPTASIDIINEVIKAKSEEESNTRLGFILLVAIMLMAMTSIFVICIYNKRKQAGKGCFSFEKVSIRPKKSADQKRNINCPGKNNSKGRQDSGENTSRASGELQRRRLKPVLSFTYRQGKINMEMESGEYENVQYNVRYDDNDDISNCTQLDRSSLPL